MSTEKRIPYIRSDFLKRHRLEWYVGCHSKKEETPARWVLATVPGGAQNDWAKALGWKPLHFAAVWRQYDGMEDLFWTYRARLPSFLPTGSRTRWCFVCEGVDYECDVLVGGEVLHHHVGLHIPIDLDLTRLVADSGQPVNLDVRIYPAPKADTENTWGETWAKTKRTQAYRVTKPSISYGDDCHPRVIPLGLWQDAYLDERPARYINSVRFDYDLENDFSTVRIRVDCALNAPLQEESVCLRIRSQTGEVVAEARCVANGTNVRLETTLQDPALWWPNGHGEQALYVFEVEIRGRNAVLQDSQRWTCGFRRVRLVMHEGAWMIPHRDRWPKTRSNPPMAFEVNGRTIFARGACCTPMNIFFGTVTAEECEQLVQLAKTANFNMLRISGGCVAFKPEFYDACDRLGLMLWQDFPLACNNHPDDDEYLDLLDRESRAMISRLAHHPALALWCGGNELFELHSGMTDQSLALRLLNRNTFELDRSRPFIPSTPLMGISHGPYVFASHVDTGVVDGFRAIQRSSCTAYPEFGCPAPAPVDVLKTIIPPSELFPPRKGTAWEDHHAFFPFVEREWLDILSLEYYFGPIESLEQLVDRGQLLQGECLRAIYEEARRQQPTCSAALMWSLNEPWPNAANLSLLSWPQIPKNGYAKVAAACRPVLASLRVEKYGWRRDEPFVGEVWLLSDEPSPLGGGQMRVYIGSDHASAQCIASWEFDEMLPQKNQRGIPIIASLSALASPTFYVLLRVEGRPELDSDYQFCFAGPMEETPRTSA